LAIPVILTGLTACDNVGWGGVQVRVQAPPPAQSAAEADTAGPVVEAPPPLDLPPALFLVERASGESRLLPVAFLRDGALRPLADADGIEEFARRFREERMSGHDAFILFAGGHRVGGFFPTAPGPIDSTWCAPRPIVTGRIEVQPGASGRERFLALPEKLGRSYPRSDFTASNTTRAQRVGTLNMAAALFATRNIRWPPSILEARQYVEAFQPLGSDSTELATTFMYGDSLAVGPAPNPAYSLFILGTHSGRRYEPTYVRYRRVGDGGKAAARWIGHMDWDRDGADDALLEVFGTEHRWFAALARRGEAWRQSFQEPCPGEPGAGGPTGVGEEAGAGTSDSAP